MKTTIVPAQITTVEDKVAGNLSFTQLILLIIPVFICGAIFTFIPPMLDFTLLKAVAVGSIAMLFVILAVRLKGRLILEWIVVRTRYNHRPRYYVFNKNDPSGRSAKQPVAEPEPAEKPTRKPDFEPAVSIDDEQLARYEAAERDPNTNIRFETTRKGGLRVSIRKTE